MGYVDPGRRNARDQIKRTIAIGGGTVIDIAKVLAVSDGEGVDDLADKAPIWKEAGLIIIPTTCGHGQRGDQYLMRPAP